MRAWGWALTACSFSLLGCGARTPLSELDDGLASGGEGSGAAGFQQSSGSGAQGAGAGTDDGPVAGGLKPDAQWAKQGRNSSNTALAGSKSYAKGKVKWSVTLGNDVSPTTPVIDADGTVYVGCSQGLCAFGPDGQKRWASGQEDCPYGSPAIAASGKIFSSCGAIDAEKHTLLWSVKSKGLGMVRGPITIGGKGTVYVSTELGPGAVVGGKLTAFSQGGKQLWQLSTPGTLGAMAIGPDDTLYHTSFSWGVTDVLRALTPEGTKKWEFQANERLGEPIVMPDGSLVVPGEAHLFALSAEGKKKWSIDAPTTQFYEMPCAALGPDGTIYVGGDGVLHAVTPGGKKLWSTAVKLPAMQYPTFCPVVDGDGTIYAVPDSTVLFVVSPAGKTLWQLPFGNTAIPHYKSSPALAADGTLYVTNLAAPGEDLTSMLYAIGP